MSGAGTASAPLGLELQGLYDEARLARELGISRAAANRIMRALPKFRIDGMQKTYAKASDIERYIAERTVRA